MTYKAPAIELNRLKLQTVDSYITKFQKGQLFKIHPKTYINLVGDFFTPLMSAKLQITNFRMQLKSYFLLPIVPILLELLVTLLIGDFFRPMLFILDRDV